MTDMQQFISMAAGKLGVSESTTRTATAGILGFVQKRADGGDFSQVLSKISGAGDVLKEAPKTETGGGGGMLGGLMGKASSALGGGSALDLLALFQKSGLGTDKAGPLASMFLEFVKSKAGPDLTNKILAKVPEVKQFLG